MVWGNPSKRAEARDDNSVRTWKIKGYESGHKVDQRFRGTAAAARERAADLKSDFGWTGVTVDRA